LRFTRLFDCQNRLKTAPEAWFALAKRAINFQRSATRALEATFQHRFAGLLIEPKPEPCLD
jgi:hypothetical protein